MADVRILVSVQRHVRRRHRVRPPGRAGAGLDNAGLVKVDDGTDQAGPGGADGQIKGASRSELETAARQVMNRAKVLAPVDTGRLRASIRVESRRILGLRSRYTIGSDLYYAPYVNDGTRPHIIRPGTRRRSGSYRRARGVRHGGPPPGHQGRPFLDQALREIAAGRGTHSRTDSLAHGRHTHAHTGIQRP